MKKYIGLFVGVATALTSCNDDFLEKFPQNKPTEQNAFVTYDNFKSYSWEFYEEFSDESNYLQYVDAEHASLKGDYYAGYASYLYKEAGDEPNPYRNGTATAPSSGNGWDFSFVRRANILLSKIEDSKMTGEEKLHWEAVGKFWRAYAYAELISRFGDVPWIDIVLNENSPERFKSRDPRKVVADNVLADLQFVEKNINAAGDGPNTINLDVVRALMSRFTLFEGTWRKYHNLGDYQKYIDEAVRVSLAVVKSNPEIMPEVDGRYITESLVGQPGILLCKEYVMGIMTHNRARYVRTEAYDYEFPKSTVDMFLTRNGLPIHNAENTADIENGYHGDKNLYKQFRNRDLRLLAQVLPPYSIQQGFTMGANAPNFDAPKEDSFNETGYYYDGVENVKEYMDLCKREFNAKGKQLPAAHFAGTLVWTSPHITGPGAVYTCSRSGFTAWKEYNIWEDNSGNDTSDKAIFWIEEAMLNLAEAYYEQNGSLSQEIADMTINKLRARAKVASMQVSQITDSFDPTRDNTVEPMLWEIRRERYVELLGEGFGFGDIRRWKKGPWYINRPQVGAYINKDNFYKLSHRLAENEAPTELCTSWNQVPLADLEGNKIDAREGYVQRFANPVSMGLGWQDKYYLFAIPTNELILSEGNTKNDLNYPDWN